MKMDKIIGYVALFINVGGKGTIVEFPDLPGCFAQGDSMEEAICNAQEALAIYHAEMNGELPPASSLKDIQSKKSDAVIQIVAINTKNYQVKSMKTINKNLTLPEWLNTLSEKYHLNFSQILRTALINHLSNLDSLSPYDRQMLNG